MKTKSFKIAAIVFALSQFAYTPAHAVLAVVDVAANPQWVIQLTHMATQIEQARARILQLKQTYDSLNGMRNISSLLQNELVKQALPADYQTFLKAVQTAQGIGASSGISGSIQAVLKLNQVITCESTYGKEVAAVKACKERWSKAAAEQVMGQSGFDAAFKDMDNLAKMLTAIRTSPDAKSIADLQARLQLQQIKASAEATKLETYRLMEVAKDKMEYQRVNDLRAAGATRVLR